jgi:hypothetical protein
MNYSAKHKKFREIYDLLPSMLSCVPGFLRVAGPRVAHSLKPVWLEWGRVFHAQPQ